jgi:hypothetical protein
MRSTPTQDDRDQNPPSRTLTKRTVRDGVPALATAPVVGAPRQAALEFNEAAPDVDPYGISCNAEGLQPDGANVVRFQSRRGRSRNQVEALGEIMAGEIRAALSGCGGNVAQPEGSRPANESATVEPTAAPVAARPGEACEPVLC